MATQICSLREYFRSKPDPRAATPGALDLHYRPGNHITAADLRAVHTRANEPLVLLGVDDNMSHPMPMCLAYDVDVVGDPNNTNLTYALVGDTPDNGTQAPAIALADESFDDMPQVRVPTHASIVAQWGALGPNGWDGKDASNRDFLMIGSSIRWVWQKIHVGAQRTPLG